MTSIILRRLFSPLKRNDLTFRFTEDYQIEAEAVRRIRNFTQQVIDERRLNKESDSKSKKSSLLDILLQAKIDDKPMTDEELIDEVQSFLFAVKQFFERLFYKSKSLSIFRVMIRQLQAWV